MKNGDTARVPLDEWVHDYGFWGPSSDFECVPVMNISLSLNFD